MSIEKQITYEDPEFFPEFPCDICGGDTSREEWSFEQKMYEYPGIAKCHVCERIICEDCTKPDSARGISARTGAEMFCCHHCAVRCINTVDIFTQLTIADIKRISVGFYAGRDNLYNRITQAILLATKHPKKLKALWQGVLR